MKYQKPELRNIGSCDELYCANGSLATTGSGTMCSTGNGASNANSYCNTGNGNNQTGCLVGTVPQSGFCSLGHSAAGWSTCSTGGFFGTTCATGSGT